MTEMFDAIAVVQQAIESLREAQRHFDSCGCELLGAHVETVIGIAESHVVGRPEGPDAGA